MWPTRPHRLPSFSRSRAPDHKYRTKANWLSSIAGSFCSSSFMALAVGAMMRLLAKGRPRLCLPLRSQYRIDVVASMKRAILAAAFILVAQSLQAQEYKDFGKDRLNNSPRHGEWIDIKSGDRTIKAFVVYPERKDKAPVVLVIQEIFGLTDWLRSLCDELAENGVIAIAPDFLNGQKFED